MSKANEALDRMAENARELGLDYEPDGMHHNKPQKRPQNCGTGYCSCIECVMEPAQQEPVAWMEMVVANLVREGVNKHKARELAQHFYTSPPAQRPWVGLTSEELDEMFRKTLKGKKLVNWVARAIEAKLREKNNG